MKKIFIFFMLLANLLNAQEEVTAGELMINVKDNFSNPKNVAIQIQKWSDLCWTAYNNVHDLTYNYNGTTIYTPYPSNHQFQIFGCWEHPTGPPETMGLALYKITAYVQTNTNGNYVYKDHFYIDYRTSAIPEYCPAGCDYGIDFSVYYGVFRYVYTTTVFPENVQIWNLISLPYIPTELEPLAPQDLVQTATYGSPVLSWVHPDNAEYRTGYNIYRSISSGDYVLVGSTDESTDTFRDIGIQLNGGGTAYYKVKAINGSRESVSSNIISVNIISIDKKLYKLENQTLSTPILSQNYPNPFNPTTKIDYSIPIAQEISIVICDILGKEIIELVNGYKDAGEYSIEFDASNLNSGVYFYVMRSNTFIESKKFIFLK